MNADLPLWPAGASTGVGSMPGVDAAEALRTAFGECPALPFLPELPARGPGADVIGRSAGLLAGLHVDLQPAGWRLVDRPGLEERRARSLLARDLDALEEHAEGYTGPLKLAAVGPWTLAATIELPRGGRALSDPGACRDLASALAEGLAAHLADVARRVPGAALLMQLDEPALTAVLRGRVPTPSGFRTLRAVHPPVALDALRSVVAACIDAAAVPVVHCCGDAVPIEVLLAAGVGGLSLDLTRLTAGEEEALGAAAEAGVGLLLGAVASLPESASDAPERSDAPVLSAPARTVEGVAGQVRALWRRLGLPAEHLRQVAVTPTCGLAGASPQYARAALALCREVAHRLAEES